MEEREFTLALWALARAYIPSCDETGVPIHFHSSTTSGSTSRMSLRISANLSPLQSPRSAMLSSIRSGAADDLATALRGLVALAGNRLAPAFLATFADFLDVLLAIVFTPGLR